MRTVGGLCLSAGRTWLFDIVNKAAGTVLKAVPAGKWDPSRLIPAPAEIVADERAPDRPRWYRVFVGHYATHAEAEARASWLLDHGLVERARAFPDTQR